jgi:hypothetical protein
VGLDFPLGHIVDEFNQSHSDFLVNWLEKQNTQSLPFYMPSIMYKPGTDILEESQQFQVCVKLLQKGHTVFVQQDSLIPTETIKDLDQKFGQRIQFERKTDLTDRGLEFFEITIN